MAFWKQFTIHLPFRVRSNGALHLDASLMSTLQGVAEREGVTVEHIAAELLTTALAQRQMADLHLEGWRILSVREREVAALVCLNYTNRQIAARLAISPETVKTHLRNILNKFDLHSKEELRQLLSGWDFSSWESNLAK